MYNLEDIFKQSLKDDYSAILDTPYVEARLVFGIKIVRDRESGCVEILNTSRGGDYYQEITDNQYQEFYLKGWRHGVYIVSLQNHKRKLNLIDLRVNEAIKDLSPKKVIDSYHQKRKNILNRYTKITSKLNLLHNE